MKLALFGASGGAIRSARVPALGAARVEGRRTLPRVVAGFEVGKPLEGAAPEHILGR